jgi:hypothetical protein
MYATTGEWSGRLWELGLGLVNDSNNIAEKVALACFGKMSNVLRICDIPNGKKKQCRQGFAPPHILHE